MENEPKETAAVTSPPSPSLPDKNRPKRNPTPAYTATEDTFKDTANLVKEDPEM